MFTSFPEATLPFLAELEANNTKEWFEANRQRYDDLILSPSKAFVEEMGEHLMALVPTINAIPKVNYSLFRIYRDQRFHFDEPPMKTRIGIIFWQGGGKRMQSSSFYLHFDKEKMLIASGIRRFKPPLLAAYREYLREASKRKELAAILEAVTAEGYRLPDRRYKRLPRGFDVQMSHADFLLYDAMYAFTETEASLLNSSLLIDTLYRHYEAMLPLHEWVYAMTLTCDGCK